MFIMLYQIYLYFLVIVDRREQEGSSQAFVVFAIFWRLFSLYHTIPQLFLLPVYGLTLTF